MKKMIMGYPSGSLSAPADPLPSRCPKDVRRPILITGYPGITYTASKGSSGKTNFPRIFGATLRRHWLPEGITGWSLNFRDKWEFKRFRERLQRLTKQYRDEDTEIVEEVLRRDATPGALAALRYCDWFLTNGGAMSEVGILGNVVLKSGIDTTTIEPESISGLSIVSLALIDSGCDPDAYLEVVKLTLEHVENSDLISEIITNRGVTEASIIKELLEETLSTAPAVQSGVL